MKRSSVIGLTIGITVAGCAVWVISNPLLRSEASIEAALLRTLPLGSSIDDVVRALRTRGVDVKVLPTGVYKQKNPAKPEVVGVSSIRMELGTALGTHVTAFWAFDDNGKLIDVWVWKTSDGLG
jgi:hypothetical protein